MRSSTCPSVGLKPGNLWLLVLGMAAACSNSSGIPEKIDAGQRKYCDAYCFDAATVILDGSRTEVATIELGPTGVIDSSRSETAVGDVSVDLATTETRPDLTIDVGITGTGDSGLADAFTNGTGGAVGTGGTTGPGGTGGSPTADAPVDHFDKFDIPQDHPAEAAVALDAGPETHDAPLDGPADSPINPVDSPINIDSGGPQACTLGTPMWAKQLSLSAPLNGLANGPDGTLWEVGNLFTKLIGGVQTPVPIDFGSGPIQSTFSTDIFLAKVNPSNGLASGAWDFGDFGNAGNGGVPGASEQFSNGVAVSSAGGPAIFGTFAGEIDFTNNNSDGSGPSATEGTAGLDYLVSSASVDFYAVFDAAGVPINSHMVNMGAAGALASIGSNPTQNAFAICGAASALVPAYGTGAGTSKGGLLIPTGAGYTNAAGGGLDIFVAKVNATTGAVIWGRQLGGTGDQACATVTLDNNGDVILSGTYTGDLSFGGTASALANVPGTSAAVLFVAKLAGSNGEAISASAWGTTGRQVPKAITVDASSNIILAGALGANIDFGGGHTIANLGLTDAFVVKFNSSLVAQWANSYGDAANAQQAVSVATSSSGDVFVSGLFVGSMGSMGLTSFSNSTSDAFVAQLMGATGALKCARIYGDAAGTQEADFVTVARTATGALADSTVIAGQFTSGIDFSAAGSFTTPSAGEQNSFITRLGP